MRRVKASIDRLSRFLLAKATANAQNVSEHRIYLKNVRRSLLYSITSFSLRRCDSASGNWIADEIGTQATSLDSLSIFSVPESTSAALS